jgi:hypothetical protein
MRRPFTNLTLDERRVIARLLQAKVPKTKIAAGPRIPEDELTRVLEPLYRLEISRSRETGGHGLGFALVSNIIQAHRERLFLSNRPKGGLQAVTVFLRHNGDSRCPSLCRKALDVPAMGCIRRATAAHRERKAGAIRRNAEMGRPSRPISSPHPIVGMTNSASERMPVGQRVVSVFRRV